MSKGMCDFMTIFEAKKGDLKIHSRRKKKTNLVSKKQTKQEHDKQNHLEKKYVDTKTNQSKNKKKCYLYTDNSNADKKLSNTLRLLVYKSYQLWKVLI